MRKTLLRIFMTLAQGGTPQVFYAMTNKTIGLEECCLEAYILINAEPGRIWDVAEAALKIEGVKMAHPVAGQFDVVAYVEFGKMEDLGKIIEKVQQIKGVRRTQTLIGIPPPIRK